MDDRHSGAGLEPRVECVSGPVSIRSAVPLADRLASPVIRRIFTRYIVPLKLRWWVHCRLGVDYVAVFERFLT